MKLVIQKASVRWQGGSNGGTRAMTTMSGALKEAGICLGIPFTRNSGTNPAELIAAAQAASFSLALSNELGLADSASGDIVVTATVTLEHLAAGWTIMNIHLNVIARLPGINQSRFIGATVRAKASCLVSRLLRANISMNAKLEQRTAVKKGMRRLEQQAATMEEYEIRNQKLPPNSVDERIQQKL